MYNINYIVINPQPQQPQNIGLKGFRIIPKCYSLFIDDYIEGEVELTLSLQVAINDITLAFNSTQRWSAFFEEFNQSLCENKTDTIVPINLNFKSQLKTDSELAVLKPGKYTFGFKFKIPNDINPSFEYPGKDGRAHLRYYLQANIISPFIKGSATTYLILKKRQKIEMNKQVELIAENNVHKWGLFNGGKTTFKITSLNGTDNFKFDEDAKFDINIDNTKGKMNTSEIKIVLTREVIFKTKIGQTKKTLNNEIFTQTVKAPTKSGENKSFPFTLSLKNIENKNFNFVGYDTPYSNISNINFFLTSIKAAVVDCIYSLKFTLYFEKFVKNNDRPRIIMNLNICHQTLDECKQEMNKKNENQKDNEEQDIPSMEEIEKNKFDKPHEHDNNINNINYNNNNYGYNMNNNFNNNNININNFNNNNNNIINNLNNNDNINYNNNNQNNQIIDINEINEDNEPPPLPNNYPINPQGLNDDV